VIDNNLNPQWVKHFNVKYIFHKDIELWFQVWHVESEEEKRLIGQTILTLSTLMMSEHQTVNRKLYLSEEDENAKENNTKKGKGRKDAGTLKIQGDVVKKSEDIVKF
jgi:hypothetical protein